MQPPQTPPSAKRSGGIEPPAVSKRQRRQVDPVFKGHQIIQNTGIPPQQSEGKNCGVFAARYIAKLKDWTLPDLSCEYIGLRNKDSVANLLHTIKGGALASVISSSFHYPDEAECIDAALETVSPEQPMVLSVTDEGNAEGHWIAIGGRDGDDFRVFDPIDGNVYKVSKRALVAKFSPSMPESFVQVVHHGADGPAGCHAVEASDPGGDVTFGATRVEPDARLPVEHGEFRVRVTVGEDGKEHALLYKGLDKGTVPLVRIHSECLTGDALGSLKCDCGPQLHDAIRRIGADGSGAIVYLRQEGRGIGLHAKVQAYALQDRGLDTLDANLALGLPADDRQYKVAADMLKDMGVTSVRLLTNNPEKVRGLEANGVRVDERVPHIVGLGKDNRYYMDTKAERMGHIL